MVRQESGGSFRVVRYLREHPLQRLSAMDIAAALGASPRFVVSVLHECEAEGMVRRFKQQDGQPVLWKVVRLTHGRLLGSHDHKDRKVPEQRVIHPDDREPGRCLRGR